MSFLCSELQINFSWDYPIVLIAYWGSFKTVSGNISHKIFAGKSRAAKVNPEVRLLLFKITERGGLY